MNVIILAIGSGLRLDEHTKDIPKALLDFNDERLHFRYLRDYINDGLRIKCIEIRI